MGQTFDLASLTDFLAVAEAGGISAGARRLGRPKQSVSRRLMQLEASVGVRLFDRSTRGFNLTPEGRKLQLGASRILQDLDEIRRGIGQHAEVVSGPLRISAPVLMGQTILGEISAHILELHPELRLELVFADRQVDLISEGFDAAIRVGHDAGTGVVVRKLVDADVILVASQSLVEASRPIAAPQHLARVPCIIHGESGPSSRWTLSDGRSEISVEVSGRLASTSLKLCLDAARAGAGVASVPAFIARDPIAEGQLVRVLPGWRCDRVPIRLVHPSKRLRSPRLQAFADALEPAFAAAGFRGE